MDYVLLTVALASINSIITRRSAECSSDLENWFSSGRTMIYFSLSLFLSVQLLLLLRL